MKAPRKVDMTWTGKPKYYGGRTLRKGDTISVSPAHARLYRATGMATDAPKQVAAVQQPAPAPTPPADDLEALRTRFETERGFAPDRRWGVTRLRNELRAAPTYQRRDMQPEE